MGGYAWVTLATNDAYSLGALVLAQSLRRVGSKHQLAVLVTPGVTATMREKLAVVFSLVQEVNVLDSKDEANLALLARPELGVTFTKLHCWRLTQYEKCVFVDADTLVVQNCDELFEYEEFSAAPDVGWPDCFNSGVFVFRPSQETFAAITSFAASKGSFDGGDQGLLNMYFSDWARKDISKHLPFIYNMCSTATYSYIPAFKKFGEDVRIIHFIGRTKPWLQYFDTLTGIVEAPADSAHLQPLLQLWWNIFCEKVHPQLSSGMATSTLAPIWHEFYPKPYEFPVPKNLTYTDLIDQTRIDTCSQTPDFFEFKDPWEEYCLLNNPNYENKSNHRAELYSSVIGNCSHAVINARVTPTGPVSQSYYESPVNDSNQSYNEKQYDYDNHNTYHPHIQHNTEQEEWTNLNHDNNHRTTEEHSVQQSQCNYNRQTDHRIQEHAYVHSDHNQHLNQSEVHQSCHRYEKVEQQLTNEYSHNDQQNASLCARKEENQTEQHISTIHQYHDSQNYRYQEHGSTNHISEHDIPYEQRSRQANHESSNSPPEQTSSQSNAQVFANSAVHHDTIAHDNVCSPKNLRFLKQRVPDNDSTIITDEQTDYYQKSTSPHPISKPCTDLQNVATQSDPHIVEHLKSSNAGLAGALAQMTLGEPRSMEQIALEEHMRKQSWEQGQIDYMGRDSFDNIWRKICETLSFAPQRLPSPPKEPASKEPEEIVTDETATVECVESTDKVDKPSAGTTSNLTEEEFLINNAFAVKNSVEECKIHPTIPPIENKSSICKLPQEHEKPVDPISTIATKDTGELLVSRDTTQEMTKDVSEESLASMDCSFIQLPVESSVEMILEQQSTSLPSKNDLLTQQIVKSAISDEVINEDDSSISPAVQLCEIKNHKNNSQFGNEQHAEILSSASEVRTVSPVPIQIAESILQAEPKESISDSLLTSQEVISSTITPVQEFRAALIDVPMKAEEKVQLNGTGTVQLPMQKVIETVSTATEPIPLSKNQAEMPKVLSSVEQGSSLIKCIEKIEDTVAQPELQKTIERSVDAGETLPSTEVLCRDENIQETQAGNMIALIENIPCQPELEKTSSAARTAEETVSPPISTHIRLVEETTTIVEQLEKSGSSISTQTPCRSSSTEAAYVPLAPRVTEAVTSTRPPINIPQNLADQEVETKESSKTRGEKSRLEEDPHGEAANDDGSGKKKVTKKVVKKVVKKPKVTPEESLDSGADSCSLLSKQKKVVKVPKKSIKPSRSLGADTSNPEASPSSSTGDTPVPPKRKLKPATTTPVVVKKSDVE